MRLFKKRKKKREEEKTSIGVNLYETYEISKKSAATTATNDKDFTVPLTVTTYYICEKCNKKFKTERGRNIHFREESPTE